MQFLMQDLHVQVKHHTIHAFRIKVTFKLSSSDKELKVATFKLYMLQDTTGISKRTKHQYQKIQ